MEKLSVDEIIRKAIEEGKFADLPGKGKPLRLDENPHAHPEWQAAYQILANAGFSLPWIETQREIAAGLEQARGALANSWAWHRTELAKGSPQNWVDAQWERARQDFLTQAVELNKRIRANNLAVPSSRFQRRLIDPQKEIDTITCKS